MRSASPEVYGCRFPGWDVYLDLKRDRYWCVARQTSSDTPLSSAQLVAPTRDLNLGCWASRVQPSRRDMWRLLRIAVHTACALEYRSMSQIVARWRRRRAQGGGNSLSEVSVLEQRMAEFQTWRPWIPWGYRCLFDSVAAAEYLAAFGCYPALVFGVEAEPFQAHCWLQEEDIVVNDTLDRVRTFSPILVV